VRQRSGYVFYDEKSGCWIARTQVTDETGRRRNVKRRAKSKAEAEQKLKGLLRQIDDEGSKVVDYNLLIFNDLADHYEKHYLKPAEYVDGQKVSGLRAVERPKRVLINFREFFGKMKLREITYGYLLSYRETRFKSHTQYKRQRTMASWNREAAVLQRIFNIACQQGWLLKNPFKCGDPLIIVSAERRRETILTVTEETKLLAACDSHPQRTHLGALIVFLIDTGCRKSEALKLRWKFIDFTSRLITIEGMTTKTLKTRHVVMTERLYRELASMWYAAPKEAEGLVFGITNNVRKSFASACKEAGIKHGGIDGLTLHCLRHTAATRLVQGGMSVQLAGRILGHSQVNTTYRYLSANMETAARAAAILESFQAQPSRGVMAESTSSEMVN
jgi:integrase